MFTTFSAFITAVIREFFHGYFFFANQVQTRHQPFAPLCQVDERTAKLRFSIQGRQSEFMAAKTLKNPFLLQTDTFQQLQKGKKTKMQRDKSKVTCSMALVKGHFSPLRTKIESWKFCHRPILAVNLKDFSCW